MGPRFAQLDSTNNEDVEVSSTSFEVPAGSQLTLARDTSLGCAILSHPFFGPLVQIRQIKATCSIAALIDVLLAGRSLGGCGG
jgi:hypothetical protein